MTPEEMKAKSAEKAAKVQALCNELKVELVPQEILTTDGIIKKVIFYVDHEVYPTKEKDIPSPGASHRGLPPPSARPAPWRRRQSRYPGSGCSAHPEGSTPRARGAGPLPERR